MATVLLFAVAVLFVIAHLVPNDAFWLELLRAGSEAALVGGLADWFAVVALFRHPLGIPIPHTAVIPSNKNRIAESLGTFVENNFLDPELIAERLHRSRPARRLAAWLRADDNARWVSTRLAETLPLLLGTFGDREVRKFLGDALKRGAAGTNMAPIVGEILATLRDSDRHQLLFDHMLAGAGDYLRDQRGQVLRVVEAKSAWWVPRKVDRKVAEALADGVIELLDDLGDRNHLARRRFDGAVADLIERLKHNPELAALVSQWFANLLKDEPLEAFLQRFLAEMLDRIRSDLTRHDSSIVGSVTAVLISLAAALERDESMCQRLDEKIVAGARSLLVPWRHQIGAFISDVVKSWDSETITERLESAVGRDLQYIRINGTLVGALVGCLLYLLVHFGF
jgi:uncharacterized membrane-anchored protein YjiN (DUF445 family)